MAIKNAKSAPCLQKKTLHWKINLNTFWEETLISSKVFIGIQVAGEDHSFRVWKDRRDWVMPGFIKIFLKWSGRLNQFSNCVNITWTLVSISHLMVYAQATATSHWRISKISGRMEPGKCLKIFEHWTAILERPFSKENFLYLYCSGWNFSYLS